jgi:hypothetical protein
MEVPVMKFPSIKAVAAKRRSTWLSSDGFFMQMHVDHLRAKGKQETPVLSAGRRGPNFIAR